MASNTITVIPRKKTTSDVVAPKRRTAVQTPVTTGTVLLQTPLPKYAFDLKPKKTSNKQADKTANKSQGTLGTNSDIKTETNQAQHVNVGSDLGRSVIETIDNTGTAQISGTIREKPINKVGPITSSLSPTPRLSQSVNQSAQLSLTSTGVVCVTDISPNSSPAGSTPVPLPSPVIQQNTNTTLNISHPNEDEFSNAGTQSESVTVDSVRGRAGSQPVELVRVRVGSHPTDAQPSVPDLEDKIKHLEEEKHLLRNQLDVQLQVNQELKKLLVASVGEDLQHRVERLTRDRALMSAEIGDYSKKLVEDYEHLDKISIQADMWRSKYLACRVMSDELASSRAFYSMQFKECQMALQQLLSERHELRMNLYESYRGLQLVQEAFDPLNSHGSMSHSLTSKNILDLARTNQHLVDSIKYRLLPSHVTSSMNKKLEVDWNDYLTPAESHARQLMSREMRPEDFRHLATPLPPGAMSVDRYHPFQNFDNLTFNVCKKCKGDISVV